MSDVSGQVLFEEELPRVSPINKISAELLASHTSDMSDELILRQRHQVRAVPVTKVKYDWKSKPRSFYVFGYERRVHAMDYPQDCCWGCVVT